MGDINVPSSFLILSAAVSVEPDATDLGPDVSGDERTVYCCGYRRYGGINAIGHGVITAIIEIGS